MCQRDNKRERNKFYKVVKQVKKLLNINFITPKKLLK